MQLHHKYIRLTALLYAERDQRVDHSHNVGIPHKLSKKYMKRQLLPPKLYQTVKQAGIL